MSLALNKPKLDNLAGDIWKSAERLRGKFKAYEYPAVDDKDFGPLLVPLPTLPEQDRIAAFLRASGKAIDAVVSQVEPSDKSPRPSGVLNQQMETLLAYRKSLIHECVTGQRRISGADVARVQAAKPAEPPAPSAHEPERTAAA